MNYKNYEKRLCLYFLIVMFFLSLIIFTIFLCFNKHYTYLQFTGVVHQKSVTLLIENTSKKYFYQNNSLYLNNHQKKFKILKHVPKILKRKNTLYDELVIEFSYSTKDYQENDPITISLKKEKQTHINLLKYIWKEE